MGSRPLVQFVGEGKWGEVGKVLLIWGYKGTDKRNGNNLPEQLGKSGQER